ncbi:UDP-N-acetylmuramoyl-tripeptide--D-alanyl-D-alanine ligase [candidate division WWE3 bacterium]|nr:UDP-N-acetylmuramoyl-tripeptide--D-alanyl-D-alanine ligase [candidate division WWE3 bacterium]
MLKKLIPIELQLNIFQLEEYSVSRFILWLKNNLYTRKLEEKKKLVWTHKARFIYRFALFYFFSFVTIAYVIFGVIGLLLSLLSITQPYLFLILGLLTRFPYEFVNRRHTKNQTNIKLKTFSKLKVIGITGSYGKTSVKEFLYTILKQEYNVLKTPESYNTLFGISKVVDLELDGSYDFFICEMGAYKIGEINELCEMVNPTYAILTGINEQHLERFGSIENTTKAKFELINSLPENGFGLVNIDNKIILNNYKKYAKKLIEYGHNSSFNTVTNCITTLEGTKFDLMLNGVTYQCSTHLIGNSNLTNLVAAATMAYNLGTPINQILHGISLLRSVPHRLELKVLQVQGITLIDDAYNSNPTGFHEALETLKLFTNHTKVLVTPGIVELGQSSEKIHHDIGEKADYICDFIFLVGNNDRTKALANGVKNKEKIIMLKGISELWLEITKLKLTNPVVLIENDLPDNY